MNCDKCGKPSVYRSTLIVNGVSETKNLCRDCAIKEGVFSTQTSLFDDMLMSFAGFSALEQVENIVCPVCKTSLREFNSTKKLGCNNCYEVFRPQILEVLKHIAPSLNHKQQAIKPNEKKKESKEDKISNLRHELQLAVKEERYEDASKIKKQIQKLEAGNE